MDSNVLLSEILERVVRVETKIDDYTALREKVDKTHNIATSNEKSVAKIEDSLTWLWRAVGSIIIFAVIGTVIITK